jgi:hypothetical protein
VYRHWSNDGLRRDGRHSHRMLHTPGRDALNR